ncbi:MAG: glycosyltransferase, partial [Gillisia sp.]
HVPYIYNEEVNRTIQTKIYQYTLMYKPMIVSHAKLVKEFVEKNNIGLSIKDLDPKDFADKVLKLKENSELYEKMSKNCKKVAAKKNWEKTVLVMLNSYKEMLYES